MKKDKLEKNENLMDDISKTEKNESDKLIYSRGTLEFSRLTNLGDGVFAIAMTLLVLNIGIPDVSSDELAVALISQMPQFMSFFISFGLIANIWYQHHKLFQLFSFLNPIMIWVHLVFFGAVVLVPFPAALIGKNPNANIGIMILITLFIILNLMFFILTLYAYKAKALRRDVSKRFIYWLSFNYIGGIIILCLAFVLSIWFTLIALIIIASGIFIGPFASNRYYKKFSNPKDSEMK